MVRGVEVFKELFSKKTDFVLDFDTHLAPIHISDDQ